jgi:hypothetical protein
MTPPSLVPHGPRCYRKRRLPRSSLEDSLENSGATGEVSTARTHEIIPGYPFNVTGFPTLTNATPGRIRVEMEKGSDLPQVCLGRTLVEYGALESQERPTQSWPLSKISRFFCRLRDGSLVGDAGFFRVARRRLGFFGGAEYPMAWPNKIG